MKKNYLKVCMVMTVMVLLLTGCGSSFPDLSPEEENMVGEYAAMLLLKYDANNRGRLVPYEEVEAAEERQARRRKPQTAEPTTEPTRSGMDPVDDTPVIEIGQETDGNATGSFASLEDFYDLPEGITITYLGNEICDSYPKEESVFFALDASEGKRLIVLKFGILNQTQTDQNIDLMSQNQIVRITVNGDYNRNALTTMLSDDMLTYRGDIPVGESVNVVLLAELDSDKTENISSLSLNLKNDSKTYTIHLQ